VLKTSQMTSCHGTQSERLGGWCTVAQVGGPQDQMS
jgi:hypothetical protein